MQAVVAEDSSYVAVALDHHVVICSLYCPQPTLGVLLNKLGNSLNSLEEAKAAPALSASLPLIRLAPQKKITSGSRKQSKQKKGKADAMDIDNQEHRVR